MGRHYSSILTFFCKTAEVCANTGKVELGTVQSHDETSSISSNEDFLAQSNIKVDITRWFLAAKEKTENADH